MKEARECQEGFRAPVPPALPLNGMAFVGRTGTGTCPESQASGSCLAGPQHPGPQPAEMPHWRSQGTSLQGPPSCKAPSGTHGGGDRPLLLKSP